MEPEEIKELQDYLNSRKQNKKIITMPQEFWVAEKNDVEEFVSGIDEFDEPTFSADLNDAEWSFSETTVLTFINRYAIVGVKAKPKQGANHPTKPPING